MCKVNFNRLIKSNLNSSSKLEILQPNETCALLRCYEHLFFFSVGKSDYEMHLFNQESQKRVSIICITHRCVLFSRFVWKVKLPYNYQHQKIMSTLMPRAIFFFCLLFVTKCHNTFRLKKIIFIRSTIFCIFCKLTFVEIIRIKSGQNQDKIEIKGHGPNLWV